MKSITELIEEVKEDICSNYCKYPCEEGHEEDWLINDENSPCYKCPLNKL